MSEEHARQLYHTTAWQKCRQYVLTRDKYLCQPCLRRGRLTPANTVHHIKPLEEYPELALDEKNLESCCATCHNQIHKRETEKQAQLRWRRARIIRIGGTV